MVTKELQITQSDKNQLINALKIVCFIDDSDVAENKAVIDVIVTDIFREYEFELEKALFMINSMNPMVIIQKLTLPESIFSNEDEVVEVDTDKDITLGRVPVLTLFDDDPDLDTEILAPVKPDPQDSTATVTS